MKTVHVFTAAAGNYLPKARALFASVRKHHPSWKVHLAVSDGPPPAAALESVGADENHMLHELGIPSLRRWIFSHTLIELATAIKPFVLRKLLARPDCEAVIYFDPDVVVFSPLEEITRALADADIALTPHLTHPHRSLDDIVDYEISTLRYGIYNLGFIAVAAGAEGKRFADWWAHRLYRYCREDAWDGLYLDQRWIDFIPAFFDSVKILRSPAFNAARWNLSSRAISGDFDHGFKVDGEPLGFFHFSQVDLISDARATGNQPAVAKLLAWYQRAITPTLAEQSVAPSWAYAVFADGARILLEQRLVYRARPDLQRAYPDPFAAGPGTYADWWQMHARAAYPALFDPTTRETEVQRLQSLLAFNPAERDIVEDEDSNSREDDAPRAQAVRPL